MHMANTIRRVFIFLSCLLTCGSAFSWATTTSDKVWRSGWGHGVAEAEVTYGSGNTIYVACNDGSNFDSSIDFTLAGDGPKGNQVLFIFDGGQPETVQVGKYGTVASDSYAGDATFRHLLKQFKAHKQVYVRFTDGREATFTLNGASKAIGNCRSTFP